VSRHRRGAVVARSPRTTARRGAGRRRTAAVLLLLGLAGAAAPIERLTVSVADMAGPGWRAGAISMSLDLRTQGGGLVLEVGKLTLPAPLGRVTAAALRCDTVQARGTALSCPQAVLTLRVAGAAPATVTAALELDPAVGALRLRVREQELLGGRVQLHLDAGPDGVTADLAVAGLDAGWVGDAVALVPGVAPLAVGAGVLDAEATLNGRPGGGRLAVRMRLRGLDFSDAVGGRRRGAPAGGDRLPAPGAHRDRAPRAVCAHPRGAGGRGAAPAGPRVQGSGGLRLRCAGAHRRARGGTAAGASPRAPREPGGAGVPALSAALHRCRAALGSRGGRARRRSAGLAGGGPGVRGAGSPGAQPGGPGGALRADRSRR
jgi:hypothetical protein